MISIVCPFYNEELAVQRFFKALSPILGRINHEFEIICVNDGSVDETMKELLSAQRGDKRIRIVELSRNFGKEAALTAGIDIASGEAVIPIDADLQDPPELIVDLIARWHEGYEVVLAKRADRKSDPLLKRMMAHLFYKIHNAISETPIPDNVGDFRLMDRKVIDALKRLPERRRFMKGLFSWIGFRTTIIEFSRQRRSGGGSKFSGWRLWNFALEGITAFSMAPLRMWTYIGTFIAMISFVYGLYIVVRTLLYGVVTPGYASLIVIVLFIGGVQLIGVGLLGEYIGRIYSETKQRPIYIVRAIHDGK